MITGCFYYSFYFAESQKLFECGEMESDSSFDFGGRGNGEEHEGEDGREGV